MGVCAKERLNVTAHSECWSRTVQKGFWQRTAQTMQASLPPSSIWMGTMPAFLQMLMPVSPPVKLQACQSW